MTLLPAFLGALLGAALCFRLGAWPSIAGAIFGALAGLAVTAALLAWDSRVTPRQDGGDWLRERGWTWDGNALASPEDKP